MRWMRQPYIAAPMMMGAMVVGLASVAWGQNGDWFRGQTVQPGDGGAQAANAGRDFGQAGNPAAGAAAQSDFPTDPVHEWVVASARAARSRALLHLAEKQLDDAIRDSQWSFEQSKEFREASAAEKAAYDTYTQERQKALQSVINDPKYVAAVDLRDQLADRLEKLRAIAKPNQLPREELLAIASQKLQYSTEAHNMERDAMDKDTALQDARQKMVDASARVAQLRQAFDSSVRMNPQIAQARRNLDMARVDLITAEAYYSAAATASAVATDYSYYRHRWDGVAAPVFANGWGPNGYGPGY